MTTEIKVPRMAKGKFFRGPDYYGCCNTGTAPVLLHDHSGRYIVGPEFYVMEHVRRALWKFPRKRIFRNAGNSNEVAYVYKTRKPAVEKYTAICLEAINRNTRLRAEHKADYAAAQSGDIGAALRLGDY